MSADESKKLSANLRQEEAGPRWPQSLLIFLAVFAASMAVYLMTVAPTFTGEDSGELITAAWCLGVAHPPGYPVYVLYGKAMATLLPFGEVAWRLNVASAIAAALTAAVMAMVVLRLTRNRLAALAAGLTLAWSDGLWSHAVAAEVYTLNAVFIALLIYFAVLWKDKARPAFMIVGAAVLGIGLGVHSTTALIGAVIVLYFLWSNPKVAFRPLALIGAIAAGLLMLSLVYGFTMWCARRHPYLNWGDPETFSRLAAHVLRKQYGESTMTSPFSIFLSIGQFGVILSYLAKQFTGVVFPLAALGMVLSFRRVARSLAVALLGVLFVSTFAFMLITNFELEMPKIHANYSFFLPANLVLAVWIGIALDEFMKRLKALWEGWRVWEGVVALAAVVVFLPLKLNWSENDYSQYSIADTFSENVLYNLPQNAVLFSQSDIVAFGLLYNQGVRGFRPDIALFLRNANASLPSDPLRDLKARWRTPITEGAQAALIREILKRDPDRPLFFDAYETELVRDLFGDQKVLRPMGVLYEVLDAQDKSWAERSDLLPNEVRGNPGLGFRMPANYGGVRDLTVDYIFSKEYYMYGLTLFGDHKDVEAVEALKVAVDWADGIKEVPYNAAIACYEHNRKEEAAKFLRRALQVAPNYERAQKAYSALMEEGR